MLAGPYLKFTWSRISLNLIFALFRATNCRLSNALFFTGVLYLVMHKMLFYIVESALHYLEAKFILKKIILAALNNIYSLVSK